MAEFRVTIPEETFQIAQFRQEDLPGIAAVNSALVEFESREVFRWHLSIMMQLDELVENGMPSQSERGVVEAFEDVLDARLKGQPAKPNALFLSRITWNGTRELIYRVYDADLANGVLQEVISAGESPRAFDFRMDDDPAWNLATWHLGAALGR